MKKIFNYLLTLIMPNIVFVLLFFIIVSGGYYGFHISVVSGILLFMIITILFRKKAADKTDKFIKTVLIALPVIVFAGFCLTGQRVFSYSPPFLFAPSVGILLALLFEKITKKAFKAILFLIPILIGLWLYFQGGKFWQHYIIYETFSSGETFKKAPMFALKQDSVILTNTDFKGKIVVLYFWDTSCTYCIQKFPALKAKTDKWSKSTDILFYSVNCPLERDTIGQAEAVLKARKIDMVNLTGPEAGEKTYDATGIRVFPTTIILDPSGNIVFWGDIERIDKTLEKQLKK
ncbi:MAG: TlpA disulfide reductase family protein [Bacteroidales bacterium]|nr:TlpA disulfide reductase family protein [Bacteroidales bacterium]MDD4713077.1 TlpA disulfide reductase family protein [Bacteroidales bacterium]